MSTCPCTIIKPCKHTCTCANSHMSGGCMRCATYGSEEQRRAAAEGIATAIDGRDKLRAEYARLRGWDENKHKNLLLPLETLNEARDYGVSPYAPLLQDMLGFKALSVAMEGAIREAYEIYAGMDGFIPETAPEGYLQQIIRKMAQTLGRALGEG